MIGILDLIRDPEASRANRSKASIGWMSKDDGSIMCSSRRFTATDSRDKLYPFRWLLDTDLAMSIIPDYTLDVSVVFCTFAKALTLHQEELMSALH